MKNKRLTELSERAGKLCVFRTIASVQVARGSCLLFDVSLFGSGATGAPFTLFDGEGSDGMALYDLWSTLYWSQTMRFNPPLLFRAGLYVGIAAPNASITLRYVELRD